MRTAGQGPGGFEKRDGFIKPGQDLVVAGFAGLAGTRQIFQKKREKLEGHFAPSFLRCLEEKDSYNVKEWLENELKQKNCPVTPGNTQEKAVFSRQYGIYPVFIT